MDEGTRGLGEQQQSARFQDSIEHANCRVLVNEVMKGLMTKDQIDCLIIEGYTRARRSNEIHVDVAIRNPCRGKIEHSRIEIGSDNALRRETLVQKLEGSAPAAADVDDYRVGGFAVLDQFLEIVECTLEDMLDPYFGSQEPNAKPRFRDKMRRRPLHPLLSLW